ncbi:MAG: SWIM zinc finger family protein, partial [Isosphaeraceae bacterium]|nr:SWIM zinc finger family protein [Isosphaeraceae bacterium]
MGIAQKVSRHFAEGVRARGQSYFAKGRVAITSAKAGEIVAAKVRGSETYRVKLRIRGGRLHASCTCPYFGPEGEPCKHLWATILAADARSLLQAAPVRPLKLVPDVRYHLQQPPPQDRENGQVPALPPPPTHPSLPSGRVQGQLPHT